MTNINPASGPLDSQPLSIVPDFKEILTQVIKKQMIAIGPDITIAKVKSIPGVVISDDGTVTEIAGEPKQITKELEEAFTELTGSLVKKTMEPLTEFLESQNTPPQATPAQTVTPEPAMPPVMPNPNPTLTEPSPISSGTDTVTPASPTPPIPTTPTEDAKIDSSSAMQGSTSTPPAEPTPMADPSPMENQTPSMPEPNSSMAAPAPTAENLSSTTTMPDPQSSTSSSPFTTPTADNKPTS